MRSVVESAFPCQKDDFLLKKQIGYSTICFLLMEWKKQLSTKEVQMQLLSTLETEMRF